MTANVITYPRTLRPRAKSVRRWVSTSPQWRGWPSLSAIWGWKDPSDTAERQFLKPGSIHATAASANSSNYTSPCRTCRVTSASTPAAW
jgi:hypothetical protein